MYYYSAMPGLVGALVVIAVGYAIAFRRKGSARNARIGVRHLELRTPVDPQSVFDRIRMIGSPFKVDDADPQEKIVVLSTPVSFATWGFFYPVFIHADGTGSRIDLGIQSKFIQIGPIVGKKHRDCLRAIERELSVPTARAI